MQDEDTPDLRSLLNAQAGTANWSELERHFARGVLVLVSGELDLIDVAARVAEDDKEQVEAWMHSGQVRGPEMADVKDWHGRNAEFWTVVSAPWVLIQETAGRSVRPDNTPAA